MEVATARHILLSKIYMVQVNLLKSLKVSVTIKNMSVRGFVIWKRNTTGLGGKGKLTNTEIDTVQNCFGIALRSNVGNLAFMKSACMASMYHICGYHDNCPKSADTCCQYYKDKQDNTNYYKSKGDFPIHVRRAILLIYQSLCKSDIMEKCLHGKTQNANESFNGIIWNCVLKATHVGLDFISVGVYIALLTLILVKKLP